MDTDWYLLLSTDCRDYFVYDELQFFSDKCHNFLYIATYEGEALLISHLSPFQSGWCGKSHNCFHNCSRTES